MPSIIENLNSVITTKNELGYILRENGVNPGEVFSDYPTYFRDVISSGGGGSDKVTYSYLEERLSDYVSYSYLNDNLSDYPTYSYSNGNYVSYAYLNEQEYATESYVVEYVAEHGGGDMSAYVTKTELSACGYLTSVPSEYITQAELSANSYLTEHQSLAGYATESYVADYVATYAPTPDLSTYVTKTELSAQSYATTSDLNGYLPITGGNLQGNLIPSQSASYNLGSSSSRWKEIRSKFVYTDIAYLQDTSYSSTIVPKKTNTYTLGDENNLYSATYSARLKVGNNSQIYNDGGGITLSVNSNAGIRIGSSNLYPKNNNGMNLGQSSNAWNNTYTSNIYANTSYITDMWLSDTNKFSNRSNSQINLMLNNAWRYVFHVNNLSPAKDNAITLGESSARWRSTYTANLYADNAYISNYGNLIWTGTAAEYAALPDYTTYQIYLIQE